MEKMKRWKMVFPAIFMFVAIFVLSPSTVNAAQTEDGNYNYTVKEDGSVEITNYKGDSAEAQIPAEVDGKQVTSIGNLAFNNSSITSVTIPASIKSIGAEAFDECSSLAKIYYAGSETDFGNMSIGEGNDVIGNLRDAQKITYNYEYYYEIVESSFVKIKKYIGNSKNVVIPKKIDGIDVTSIEEHAFYTNVTAENIVIPYGVTKIEQEAFSGNTKLTNLVIYPILTTIGKDAFLGCSGLKTVDYKDTQKAWQTVSIASGNESLTAAKFTFVEEENENPGEGESGKQQTQTDNTNTTSAAATNTTVANTTAANTSQDTASTNTTTTQQTKKKQPMTVKTAKKTVKRSKVKSKKQVISGAILVKKNQGKVSYKKVKKGSSSALTINKKTGKITVKKGTKKGTYKIKVKVTAVGNSNYKSGSKTVTVKIQVK